MLASRLGVKMTHIPYRGGANALTDLVAGQIQLSLLTVPTAAVYIKSGKIVPIAVLDAQRSPLLPDVPTAGEQGVSGLDVPIWCGFFLPANTPAPIVARLSGEIRKALEAPEVRDRLIEAGNAVTYRDSDAFRRVVSTDGARWKEVVGSTGIQVD